MKSNTGLLKTQYAPQPIKLFYLKTKQFSYVKYIENWPACSINILKNTILSILFTESAFYKYNIKSIKLLFRISRRIHSKTLKTKIYGM